MQAIKGLVIYIDVVTVRRSGRELELVGLTGHAWLRITSLKSRKTGARSISLSQEDYRAPRTTARMTLKQFRRRLSKKALPPTLWGLFHLLWKTCKIRRVIGHEHLQALLISEKPFIPCYWHQDQLFCVRYLLNNAEEDPRLKLGYLISPSADGDIATGMFGNQGVQIIRGSASRGGAQALREIYTVIKKQGVSPIVTPDGPRGPIYEFKPGVAMLAQLSGAPLLPISYHASHFWCLRSWDRFKVPKPFANIVMAVGEPITVSKSDASDNFESACRMMSQRLNDLSTDAMEAVEQGAQAHEPDKR